MGLPVAMALKVSFIAGVLQGFHGRPTKVFARLLVLVLGILPESATLCHVQDRMVSTTVLRQTRRFTRLERVLWWTRPMQGALSNFLEEKIVIFLNVEKIMSFKGECLDDRPPVLFIV